jgi:hypothetical protein
LRQEGYHELWVDNLLEESSAVLFEGAITHHEDDKLNPQFSIT